MGRNKLGQAVIEERERVGATIRQMREIRGFKPDELATKVGISRPYLVNIEAGRKPLTQVLLARIASALNVTHASIVPAGYFARQEDIDADDTAQVPA